MGFLDFCSLPKFFAILLYMTVGPSLILLNKYIISKLEFTYPTALSSLGVLFSGIIVHVGHRCRPDIIQIRDEVKELVTCKFYCKKIVLLGLFEAVTLHWGNDVYEYLSVSLIQMLKAFAPVLLMLLMFITGLAKVECRLILSILLLSCGTAVTSTGTSDKDNSYLGMLMMFGSEFAEAMKLCIMQKLLQGDHTPDAKTKASADATASSEDETALEPLIDLESETESMLPAGVTSTTSRELDLENSHNAVPHQDHEEAMPDAGEDDEHDDAGARPSTSEPEPKAEEVEVEVPAATGNGVDTRDSAEGSDSEVQQQQPIKFSVFETLYYYAPITFFFMTCLAIATELEEFLERYDETTTLVMNKWYMFVAGGMLGFGVNCASFGVTGLISGLYLKALGTFRNICLIGVAVVLFHESVTPQETLGFTITLLGFFYYNYIKITQSQEKK